MAMSSQDARDFLKVPEKRGCSDLLLWYRNATMQELADAFRRVASSAHPDRGGTFAALRRCVVALRACCGEAPSSRASRTAMPVTALQRLELALRSLERPQRQEALEQMPNKVRLALHRHMVAAASTPTTAAAVRNDRTCLPSTPSGATCLERRVANGRCFYRARQGLGRVEVRTQYVPCLDRALHFLAQLVQLQSHLAGPHTVDSFAHCFDQALQKLSEEGDTAESKRLRLAFRATVCCCAVKLQGPYTPHLRRALEQTLLLRDASQRRGWPRAARQLRGGVAWMQVTTSQLHGQLSRAVKAVERQLSNGKGPKHSRRVKQLGHWRK